MRSEGKKKNVITPDPQKKTYQERKSNMCQVILRVKHNENRELAMDLPNERYQ